MKPTAPNKNLICHLLEMSELDYETMLMNRGEEYLQYVLEMDEQGMKKLKYSRLFWVWWANQWDRRNRLFIAEHALDKVYFILQPQVVRVLLDLYNETHYSRSLTIYPNEVIMKMIYTEIN